MRQQQERQQRNDENDPRMLPAPARYVRGYLNYFATEFGGYNFRRPTLWNFAAGLTFIYTLGAFHRGRYIRHLQGPYDINGTSRVNAVLATNHFRDGTVGWNVNPAISMIYTLFGRFGESEIGLLFASQRMQEALARVDNLQNNIAAGRMEYSVWAEVLSNAETIEEYLGARLALLFPELARGYIQQISGATRRTLTNDMSRRDS